MWHICRIDENPNTKKVSLFIVQSAYRERDLGVSSAQTSGFVGPDDKLVVVAPSGKTKAISGAV